MSRPRTLIALVAAIMSGAITTPAGTMAAPAVRDLVPPPESNRDPGQSSCNFYDDNSVFDVLVVYTTDAKNNNASNDIVAYIKANVDIMNLCFANSRVYPRVQVVHSEELVGYADPHDNHNVAVPQLVNPSDGVIDNVHTLRDQYHADLVLMITYCINCGGTAACNALGDSYIFTPSGGFAAISSDWTPSEAIGMAHELAHTMGCGHNRDAETGAGTPVNCRYYPYSYGYDFQGNSGRWYSTIMSYGPARCGGTLAGSPCILYNNSCPVGQPCQLAGPCGPTDPWPNWPCSPVGPQKIFYFSNPNVLFDGQPTGVAIGSPNAANNAATLDNNSFAVANWRIRPGNIWVDFPYIGTEVGCYEEPFNTFIEGANAVPNNGSVIIKSGSTGAAGGFPSTKRYFVKAFGGAVRIGQ